MSAALATVDEDASAEDIARLMEERGIRRVPVVRDGRIVGIVSRADLLRAVLRPQGVERSSADADDRTLLRAVLAAMRAQPWVDTFWTYPSAHDGVVALYGFARSGVVREGLRLLVAEVPGVKCVEDHLEPMPLILRASL
jgi:hypothetical protein